jgi:hypothetical protein
MEEYAVLNQGWLAESARLKKVHPVFRRMHGTIQDDEHSRRLQSPEPHPRLSWIYGGKWDTGAPETSGRPGSRTALAGVPGNALLSTGT